MPPKAPGPTASRLRMDFSSAVLVSDAGAHRDMMMMFYDLCLFCFSACERAIYLLHFQVLEEIIVRYGI